MSSFKHIIKNYENLAKLGKEIIQHKKNIKSIPPDKLQNAFLSQEIKIQQFFDNAELCHIDWKKKSHTIDEFWTGPS
jgi:hypothetical protein